MTVETVVIDTDVASRLMAQTLDRRLRDRLADASPSVTFVTVGELYRGAKHAGWGDRREAELERWLGRLPILVGDHRVARRWGEITGQALRAGRPLPANDAWIAACCLAHGRPLATLNIRGFEQVPGLDLIVE